MSRDRILGGIRTTLDADTREATRRQGTARRLAHPVVHPRPGRSCPPAGELMQQFKDFQRTLGVDVIEVAASSEIPAAIAGYLQALGLPMRLRRGADPLLAAMPWDSAPSLTVDSGAAQDGDTTGLSRAVAGIAETGTLALCSGAANPVSLGFLPDTHLVVLRADNIVGGYEEACRMVLAENGGTMPRTLNLVTGASRTGDIGGRIVMGAHGPRRLAVFLLGNG
ncbi:MAG TPA: LUD domain-containing protein [Hyphomicrobium sp.]|jgi:L-lactate dehydrogenase complex protein LldG